MIGLGYIGAIARRPSVGAGGDPEIANVILMSEFGDPLDRSDNAYLLSTYGFAGLAETGRFGSGLFNGTSGNGAWNPGIKLETPTAIVLGSGDFTIEGWVAQDSEITSPLLLSHHQLTTAGRGFRVNYDATNNRIVFEYSTDGESATVDNSAYFQLGTDGVSLADFFNGSYHHVAVVRNGTNISVYVDGFRGGNQRTTSDTIFRPTNDNFFLASDSSVSAALFRPISWWRGSHDEIRVTIGVARYTAAFTPATAAFPTGVGDADWANVELLVSFDSPFGHWAYSSGSVTRGLRGDTGVSYHSTRGWEGFTSGKGPFYSATAPLFDLGSGDFCIELFGYRMKAITNDASILSRRHTSGSRCWSVRQLTGGDLRFSYTTDGLVGTEVNHDFTAADLSIDTDYDICIERTGTALRLFIDGVFTTNITMADATIFDHATQPIGVLGSFTSAGSPQNGNGAYLKGFRITKASRYGTDVDYTVPTLPLPIT